MPTKRYYVGCVGPKREVFRSAETPTPEWGYTYVIGPFYTKRGAEWMATRGVGNPHCVTVTDAERLARLYGAPIQG